MITVNGAFPVCVIMANACWNTLRCIHLYDWWFVL